jgi:hypothetical protein
MSLVSLGFKMVPHQTPQGASLMKYRAAFVFSARLCPMYARFPHLHTHRVLRRQARCCARVNAKLGAALTRGMVRSRSTLTPPLPGERFAVLRYATNRRSEPPLGLGLMNRLS